MKRILKIVVIIIVLFVAILFVTDKTYIFEGVRVFYLRGNYFYQSGHLGQRCISIPEYNIVITRLSHKASKKENINDDSKDVVEYIKQAMDIIKQTEKSNTNSI